MGNYLARVTLPSTTGLARDGSVNDFSMEGSVGDTVSFMSALVDFYITPAGASGDILSTYISQLVSRAANACQIAVYDRANPPGSAPVASGSFTLGAAGSGIPMPNEVACVVSFRADYGALLGRNRARRRGRVYIGPLNASAMQQNVGTDFGRPHPTFLRTLDAVSTQLLTASSASPWDWSIWSSVENAGHDVIAGWIDDAWDTQRRRGLAATARTLF